MLCKIKTLLTGVALASSSVLAGEQPPVDLNKPVTNPALVAAMQRLKRDSSSAAKDAVLVELNRANYLIAIFSDEMHVSKPDSGGKATIEKDSVIKVINTSDVKGNTYLPLFTDWDAIRLFIGKPVDTLVFPAKDAWDWVLRMGNYQGAVINPANDALPLSKQQVEYLAAQLSTNKSINRTR